MRDSTNSREAGSGKCLKKVSEGEKFPPRSLLEEAPDIEALKIKAEENNCGQHGKSQQDKMLEGVTIRPLGSAPQPSRRTVELPTTGIPNFPLLLQF